MTNKLSEVRNDFYYIHIFSK